LLTLVIRVEAGGDVEPVAGAEPVAGVEPVDDVEPGSAVGLGGATGAGGDTVALGVVVLGTGDVVAPGALALWSLLAVSGADIVLPEPELQPMSREAIQLTCVTAPSVVRLNAITTLNS
jgi:hypothetical protein